MNNKTLKSLNPFKICISCFRRKVIKKYFQKIPKVNRQVDMNNEIFSETSQLKEHFHENIIKYFDDFIEDEHLYVVLEYCDVSTV